MKTRIVLLGPPASGKGTQAGLIQERFGIPTASPGAMLRAQERLGTPLGIEAARLTRNGSMVPDAMVLELVGQWLDLHPDRFVFDGFPRTLVQADALENLLAQKGSVLDVALYFDLTLETIFERVMHRVTCSACGKSFAIGLHVDSSDSRCPECGSALIRRHDDTPEALEQRMAEYRSKTEPLVDYYRHRGLLWPLKAAEAPEVVFAEILSVLEVA